MHSLDPYQRLVPKQTNILLRHASQIPVSSRKGTIAKPVTIRLIIPNDIVLPKVRSN